MSPDKPFLIKSDFQKALDALPCEEPLIYYGRKRTGWTYQQLINKRYYTFCIPTIYKSHSKHMETKSHII